MKRSNTSWDRRRHRELGRRKEVARYAYVRRSEEKRLLDFLGGSIFSSFKNRLTSIGSPVGGVDHLSTAFTKPCSIHRINMLSRCQTPVVQMARGPTGISVFEASSGNSFSGSWLDADEVSKLCRWRSDCIRIRLAITTSVKTRSPTMISSWSRIGDRNEEKYLRMPVMHE